ncbi:SHOCT domain-containing protein [Rhodococcus antarcticus]|jgi:uncharacterized membrane protein|uniref:SHOCT domain-containing protein n=1 Tax=Rhodococcus antarcticus TaxID=2987751 RepID=A0ABY6P316_9NOCA|nr:SHOCT domain-containing protein [Rhodococcus antarcticus]UZJ26049.1 SHOCT domain-containing protein [Rhodococcus antarcticus]
MMNASGSFGLLGFSMMPGVVVVVVLGGIWLYRRLEVGPPQRGALDGSWDASTSSGDPAVSRLRERHTAGDIDDEEYERRLSALTYWR